MSAAASQYDAFKKQVVEKGRAFTFQENGQILVFPVADKNAVRSGRAAPA